MTGERNAAEDAVVDGSCERTRTLNANTQYSIVVGGEVANGTLTFANFVEPVEVAGQSALIVHHASPFVQSAIARVGVGVYDAAAAAGGAPTSPTQVFAFSLKNPSGPGLANPTAAQETLAADTTSAVSPAAHISIFAIDTAAAAQLIGTLDP